MCHLGAHAGLADEYIAEARRVAGRSQDRLGSSILPIQDGFHGKLGSEDSVKRGQTLSGIEGSISDRSPRTRGGGPIGRDAGRARFGMLRE